LESNSNKASTEPDGIRWLRILGYEQYKDVNTGHHDDDGKPIVAGEFDKLCGKHARLVFDAIENTPDTSPSKAAYIRAADELFLAHFGKVITELQAKNPAS
jgi:hypothetical protein